jgi:hypothetical protein
LSLGKLSVRDGCGSSSKTVLSKVSRESAVLLGGLGRVERCVVPAASHNDGRFVLGVSGPPHNVDGKAVRLTADDRGDGVRVMHLRTIHLEDLIADLDPDSRGNRGRVD